MNDIYVAIHDSNEYRVRAFSSLESAYRWREEVARDNWDSVFDQPENFDADLYWDSVHDEWFYIDAVELEP